jgi:hypothetical protein
LVYSSILLDFNSCFQGAIPSKEQHLRYSRAALVVRPSEPACSLARRKSRHRHNQLWEAPQLIISLAPQFTFSLTYNHFTDRQTVLKFLPGLLKLDSIDVTPEERAQAADSAAQLAPIATKAAMVSIEASVSAPQRQSPEQSNVVAAVMLLLRELDEPALMRLREHIDQRLTN